MAKKKNVEVENVVDVNETVAESDTRETISLKDIECWKDGQVEVTKILPLEVKSAMVKEIVNIITSTNDDGMVEIDYAICDMIQTMIIIREYTNLSYEGYSSSLEAYNDVYSKDNGNFLPMVLCNINSNDLMYIRNTVASIVEQKIKLTNSLEAIVNRGINMLAEKIPTDKQMKKVIKEIGKVDPEKMALVQDMVNHINENGNVE